MVARMVGMPIALRPSRRRAGDRKGRPYHADRDALFAMLPDTFTREELMHKADEMMINGRTADTWLVRWRRAGAVKQGDKIGIYI